MSPEIRFEEAAKLPLGSAAELAEYFPGGEYRPKPASEVSDLIANSVFGTNFSNHMASAEYEPETGWTNQALLPYGPLQMDPATSVLHYGQEIFEGMKAYRFPDGSIWTFRPAYNAARFNASAERMAMPTIPVEQFIGSLAALVRTDRDWVPSMPGASLYLRPMMIGTEARIGVSPSRSYRYLCIATPVGPYFSGDFSPVSIWVTQKYHRVGPGCTGTAKTGGNYAASMLPQKEAAALGYQQVCYLDAKTGKNLEELGGMNVFVVHQDGRVRTPALTGTILAGGTRSSIITLLEKQGHQVEETQINLEELVAQIESGEVVEIFACGTAAVVAPIGRLAGTEFEVELPVGPVTMQTYKSLTDIQFGLAPDTEGWMYQLVGADGE
ncbi:branched chain amino acid aminotransferase [Boudabousia liubingyangii]|uniref:branched-chain amino acid aminotransferase n=1 Tax=Boudabousia liubingyangii TaxID=1921764 RepID=UPI00093AD2DD|nr:branched-chain amino acid aminotransferase [Boudabousia liubingyangii]OKL47406.1 branched chain amino acid aminotransferase [Boudabousia liubingyangii]